MKFIKLFKKTKFCKIHTKKNHYCMHLFKMVLHDVVLILERRRFYS